MRFCSLKVQNLILKIDLVNRRRGWSIRARPIFFVKVDNDSALEIKKK